MSPVAWQQRTQLPCARGECTRVIVTRLGQDEVKLGARNAIRSSRIGQGCAKQIAYALLRHQPQDAAAGKVELRHAGYEGVA